MSKLEPPKAFISHATEDKERFVIGFATQLREKGIDAWLDRWEIQPGDSLVDKIFEDGIKNADAFLIILSKFSVAKPWVREELDSAVVRKINKLCRLIPVVIDDCEVPQAVKHLKWVRINALANYRDELSEITNAIFATNDKPQIGAPPRHATLSALNLFPSLTKADNQVFEVLCRGYLKSSQKAIGISEVIEELTALGLSDAELGESIEMLESHGCLRAKRAAGDIWLVELSTFSLDGYMRATIQDFDQQILTVVAQIVNEKKDDTTSLGKATGLPNAVILHILDVLEQQGFLKTAGPAGFPVRKVFSVSGRLGRILH